MKTAGGPRGARDRLIFALDVPTVGEARSLVRELHGEVGAFKVGKELFVHAGPQIVRWIRGQGEEIFLDLKFHDIPETVARAARQAARLGVKMLNVHASGGSTMMRRTAEALDEAAREDGLRRPILLGVTVLTSLATEDLEEVGFSRAARPQVTRMARLAQSAGMDGVVASPREVSRIRKACGPDFVTVTPGVRPRDTSLGDQKRVLTPADAARAGSHYMVVGRPIRDAEDPAAAARRIVAEIRGAGARGRRAPARKR